MRSNGEKFAKIATGTITAIVFAVLYAPLFISVLFSLVEIKRGKILWETFSFAPYFTLCRTPAFSPPSPIRPLSP